MTVRDNDLSSLVNINVENVLSQATRTTLKSNKKKHGAPSKKIRYAKEHFITERGEIIKMAAMVSDDPDVLDKMTQKSSVTETNIYTEL